MEYNLLASFYLFIIYLSHYACFYQPLYTFLYCLSGNIRISKLVRVIGGPCQEVTSHDLRKCLYVNKLLFICRNIWLSQSSIIKPNP